MGANFRVDLDPMIDTWTAKSTLHKVHMDLGKYNLLPS